MFFWHAKRIVGNSKRWRWDFTGLKYICHQNTKWQGSCEFLLVSVKQEVMFIAPRSFLPQQLRNAERRQFSSSDRAQRSQHWKCCIQRKWQVALQKLQKFTPSRGTQSRTYAHGCRTIGVKPYTLAAAATSSSKNLSGLKTYERYHT